MTRLRGEERHRVPATGPKPREGRNLLRPNGRDGIETVRHATLSFRAKGVNVRAVGAGKEEVHGNRKNA